MSDAKMSWEEARAFATPESVVWGIHADEDAVVLSIANGTAEIVTGMHPAEARVAAREFMEAAADAEANPVSSDPPSERIADFSEHAFWERCVAEGLIDAIGGTEWLRRFSDDPVRSRLVSADWLAGHAAFRTLPRPDDG